MAVDLNVLLTKRSDLDRPLSKEEFDVNYAKIEEGFRKIASVGYFFKKGENKGEYTYDEGAIVQTLSYITGTDVSRIGGRFNSLESKIDDIGNRNAVYDVSVDLIEADDDDDDSGSGDGEDKLKISIEPSWLDDDTINVNINADLDGGDNYKIHIVGNNIIAVSNSNIFLTLEYVAIMQGKFDDDERTFSLNKDVGITLDINVKSITGAEIDSISTDLDDDGRYYIMLKNIGNLDEDEVDWTDGTYNGSFQAVASRV